MLEQGILDKLNRTDCLLSGSVRHQQTVMTRPTLLPPQLLAQNFSSLTSAQLGLYSIAENYIGFPSGLKKQEDTTRPFQEVVLSILCLLVFIMTLQVVMEFLKEIPESKEVSLLPPLGL